MTTSRMLIAVALVFTVFFAVLTISVIVRTGLDILTLASLFVLVLLGVGLYGALTHPPDE
jgi:hypothetical protein